MCIKKFDAEFFFGQTYRVFNLLRGGGGGGDQVSRTCNCQVSFVLLLQ